MADGTSHAALAERVDNVGAFAREVDGRAKRVGRYVRQVDERLDRLEQTRCVGLDTVGVHGLEPHDLDAEGLVLSALLCPGPTKAAKTPRERREARRLGETFAPWPVVARWLDPVDFYSESNGRIFEALLQVVCDGAPRGRRAALRAASVIDVAAWLRARGRLAQVGGAAYLGQLVGSTPALSLGQLRAACQRLAELAARRRVIRRLHLAVAEGYGADVSLEALTRGLAADLERELVDVRARGGALFEDALGRPR